MSDQLFLPIKALLSQKKTKFFEEYFQVFKNYKFGLFGLNDQEKIASNFWKMALTDVDIHKLIKFLNEENIESGLWQNIVENLCLLPLTFNQINKFIKILRNEEISWVCRSGLTSSLTLKPLEESQVYELIYFLGNEQINYQLRESIAKCLERLDLSRKQTDKLFSFVIDEKINQCVRESILKGIKQIQITDSQFKGILQILTYRSSRISRWTVACKLNQFLLTKIQRQIFIQTLMNSVDEDFKLALIVIRLKDIPLPDPIFNHLPSILNTDAEYNDGDPGYVMSVISDLIEKPITYSQANKLIVMRKEGCFNWYVSRAIDDYFNKFSLRNPLIQQILQIPEEKRMSVQDIVIYSDEVKLKNSQLNQLIKSFENEEIGLDLKLGMATVLSTISLSESNVNELNRLLVNKDLSPEIRNIIESYFKLPKTNVSQMNEANKEIYKVSEPVLQPDNIIKLIIEGNIFESEYKKHSESQKIFDSLTQNTLNSFQIDELIKIIKDESINYYPRMIIAQIFEKIPLKDEQIDELIEVIVSTKFNLFVRNDVALTLSVVSLKEDQINRLINFTIDSRDSIIRSHILFNKMILTSLQIDKLIGFILDERVHSCFQTLIAFELSSMPHERQIRLSNKQINGLIIFMKRFQNDGYRTMTIANLIRMPLSDLQISKLIKIITDNTIDSYIGYEIAELLLKYKKCNYGHCASLTYCLSQCEENVRKLIVAILFELGGRFRKPINSRLSIST